MQKNAFFYIRAIYSSFWYWYPNPGYHHEKAQVLSFPKMSYFLGVGVSKGELLLLKVNRLWNFGSVSKIKRRHKKKSRPQFWFFEPATESAWTQPCWVHADSVPDLKNQNCGRDFFCDASFPSIFFSKFDLTLTANNSPLKSRTPKKYHIFGNLRTSAFSWWYPGYGIVFENFE